MTGSLAHSSLFKQKGPNLLTLIHLCFFVNEKINLLAFIVLSLKIWTCNFFGQISCLYFPKAKLLQVPSAVQGCAREHWTFVKERLRRAFSDQPIDEYSLTMAESIFRSGIITWKIHFVVDPQQIVISHANVKDIFTCAWIFCQNDCHFFSVNYSISWCNGQSMAHKVQ